MIMPGEITIQANSDGSIGFRTFYLCSEPALFAEGMKQVLQSEPPEGCEGLRPFGAHVVPDGPDRYKVTVQYLRG